MILRGVVLLPYNELRLEFDNDMNKIRYESDPTIAAQKTKEAQDRAKAHQTAAENSYRNKAAGIRANYKSYTEALETVVSSNCYNDIISVVEAIINELQAPNDETAKAVFDRKTMKVHGGTIARNQILNKADQMTPGNQDEINTQTYIRSKARKLDADTYQMQNGGKRLLDWARKAYKKGRISKDTAQAANTMKQAFEVNHKAMVRRPS